MTEIGKLNEPVTTVLISIVFVGELFNSRVYPLPIRHNAILVLLNPARRYAFNPLYVRRQLLPLNMNFANSEIASGLIQRAAGGALIFVVEFFARCLESGSVHAAAHFSYWTLDWHIPIFEGGNNSQISDWTWNSGLDYVALANLNIFSGRFFFFDLQPVLANGKFLESKFPELLVVRLLIWWALYGILPDLMGTIWNTRCLKSSQLDSSQPADQLGNCPKTHAHLLSIHLVKGNA